MVLEYVGWDHQIKVLVKTDEFVKIIKKINNYMYYTLPVFWQIIFLSEYGGLGLDYTFQCVATEELGSINCGGIPMAVGVQTDMATPALTK